MRDALIVSLLSVLPRRRVSRGMGSAARSRASRLGVKAFVAAYGVDVAEAEHPVEAYPDLEAFFTRRLRPGARPVDATPGRLVSPVDGRVAWVGTTVGGVFEVAPGRTVTAAGILGEDAAGERDVAVLYLSPRDYHREHAPAAGRVVRWRYVPGSLWPVFPASVARVDGLFARNERLVGHLEGEDGPLDVVLIGAFGVGRITSAFAPVTSNTGAGGATGSCAVDVRRGDELGVFHLGSTVVLIAPARTWSWRVAPGEVVRVGRPIADRA
jgi:phosphatidylserine decarboxylase